MIHSTALGNGGSESLVALRAAGHLPQGTFLSARGAVLH